VEVLKKLYYLPRKVIFILIAVAVVIPLILKIGLPVKWTPPVEAIFNAIDTMPDDKAVLLSCDFDPSTQPELYPMALAIIRHCFAAKKKLLLMSLYPMGVGLAAMALEEAKEDFPDVEYGKDYVFLGYTPGYGIVILSIGESIQKTFERDYYGTPLNKLPLMKEINNYDDIGLAVCLTGSGVWGTWVLYANTTYKQALAIGVTAVIATQVYPYLATGQIIGMMGGLKGAAEYEELLAYHGYYNKKRIATRGMDAQTITHLLIIAMIIFGNINYVILRRRGIVR